MPLQLGIKVINLITLSTRDRQLCGPMQKEME
jgi:hypothetical protein